MCLTKNIVARIKCFWILFLMGQRTTKLTLVYVRAWRRTDDKPLHEHMVKFADAYLCHHAVICWRSYFYTLPNLWLSAGQKTWHCTGIRMGRISCVHDDVNKWKHFCFLIGPLWGKPTGRRWITLTKAIEWCGALMFSLIYAWTDGWANNRDARDFTRHRAHYDTSVM